MPSRQTGLPSIGDSPTRKTVRERLLSVETSPKAKSPKEIRGTENDPSAAPREILKSFEGTPRAKSPAGRLPSLGSVPQEANTTKKVLFVETSQQNVSSKLESPDKNTAQHTSPRLKSLGRNATQETTSKSKPQQLNDAQNTSSKPQNRDSNQDTSFNRTAKNHLPSLPASPKKMSPYVPAPAQLPTRSTQSGVTLQKHGPELSFVLEEKYDERLEYQQNIQGIICVVLFQSFVHSHFNYCPLVWHVCSAKSIHKIKKIQKRALIDFFIIMLGPVYMSKNTSPARPGAER